MKEKKYYKRIVLIALIIAIAFYISIYIARSNGGGGGGETCSVSVPNLTNSGLIYNVYPCGEQDNVCPMDFEVGNSQIICGQGNCPIDPDCPPCELTSATITPNCGTQGCNIGDSITLSAEGFTGGCSAVDTLVVNVYGSDGAKTCNMNLSVSCSVSGNPGSCSGIHTFHYIPSPDCEGVEVAPTKAWAYGTNNLIAETEDVLGEFTFAQEIRELLSIDLFPPYLEIPKEVSFNFSTFANYDFGDRDEVTEETFYIGQNHPDPIGDPRLWQPDAFNYPQTFQAIAVGLANVTAYFPYDPWNNWPTTKKNFSIIDIFEIDSSCNINSAQLTPDCSDDGCNANEKINLTVNIKKDCYFSNLKINATMISDQFKLFTFQKSIIASDCYKTSGNYKVCNVTYQITSGDVTKFMGQEVWNYLVTLKRDDNTINSIFNLNYPGFGSFTFWGPTCTINTDSGKTNIIAYCNKGEQGDGTQYKCGDEFGDKIKLKGTFENCNDVAKLNISVRDSSTPQCIYSMIVPCTASGCEKDSEIVGVPEECQSENGMNVKAFSVQLLKQDNTLIKEAPLTVSNGNFYFADINHAISLLRIILLPSALDLRLGASVIFSTFAEFKSGNNGNSFLVDVTTDELTSYEETGGQLLENTGQNEFKALDTGTTEVTAKYPTSIAEPQEDTSDINVFEGANCIINAKAAAKCGANGCDEEGADYIDAYAIVKSDCVGSTYNIDNIKMIALGDGCEANIEFEPTCEQQGDNYNCSGSWTIDVPDECIGEMPDIPGANVETKYVIAYENDNPIDMSAGSFGGFSFFPILNRVHAEIRNASDEESIEGKILSDNALILNGSKSYYINEYSQHVGCDEGQELNFNWTVNGQTFTGGCTGADQKKFMTYTYTNPLSSYNVKLEVTNGAEKGEVTNTFKIKHCQCPSSSDKFFIDDCKICGNQGYKCTEPCYGDMCLPEENCADCGCANNYACNPTSQVCGEDQGAEECESVHNQDVCLGVTTASCYWDYNELSNPTHYFEPENIKCKHCDDASSYGYGEITHCSQYVDQGSCEADNCYAASPSSCNDNDCDFNGGDYVCSNFACVWDNSAGECKLSYTKTQQGGGTGQEECHEFSNYGECIGNTRTVEVTTECCSTSASNTRCGFSTNGNLYQTQSTTDTRTQLCGVISRELPLFDKMNILFVIALLAIFYGFIILKKKCKEDKKREKL